MKYKLNTQILLIPILYAEFVQSFYDTVAYQCGAKCLRFQYCMIKD